MTRLNTSYIVQELRKAAEGANPIRDDALVPADIVIAAAARLEELNDRCAELRSLVADMECTCLPYAGHESGIPLCPRCETLRATFL